MPHKPNNQLGSCDCGCGHPPYLYLLRICDTTIPTPTRHSPTFILSLLRFVSDWFPCCTLDCRNAKLCCSRLFTTIKRRSRPSLRLAALPWSANIQSEHYYTERIGLQLACICRLPPYFCRPSSKARQVALRHSAHSVFQSRSRRILETSACSITRDSQAILSHHLQQIICRNIVASFRDVSKATSMLH